MKKLVFGLFALCLFMGMVSCSKDGGKVDPQQVLDKAKAEGANWDEAQWKDAVRDMFKGLTPFFDWARDLQNQLKEAENGTEAEQLAAAAKIMADAEAKQKEFEPMQKILEEFEGLAEKYPVLKKVLDDEAFQAEIKKEFNLPDEL